MVELLTFVTNSFFFLAEANANEKEEDVFKAMICPPGTNADDSPLYVLCCNDTCSFTWTGAEHINQVKNIQVMELKKKHKPTLPLHDGRAPPPCIYTYLLCPPEQLTLAFF